MYVPEEVENMVTAARACCISRSPWLELLLALLAPPLLLLLLLTPLLLLLLLLLAPSPLLPRKLPLKLPANSAV